MAKVETIKINVDTKGAVDSMNDLSQATNEVAKEFNTAASFAERYGEELQPLTTRMGEAEDRLYEMAAAGQTATQEYQDLLDTVARYRKVQIQTDQAVDAAATTMAQKLGGALGGATAGFELMQGIMGTFGAESEEVEKALLKVQSAMAIAQGVQGIREAIPAITAFGTAIKTQAIAALTTLKGALITTGIGALVVALGFAANAMGMFGDATEDAEKEQKKLDDQLEKTNNELERQKNLTETVSQTINNRVRQELIDAKKRGASEAELAKIQREGAKDRIETLEEEEKALRKIYLQRSKSGSTKEFEAAEKAWLESSQKLTDARLTLDEQEAEITYQRIQKRKEQKKQAVKEEKEIFDGSVKAFDESVMEMDIIDNEALNANQARIEAEIQAEKDLQQQILDAQNAGLSAQQDAEFAHAQWLKELDEQKKQDRLEAAQALSDTFGQIANLFGEQTAAGKAAAIAQATIDTFLSAQKAYQATVGIPIVGPVLAPINAGIAIAAGIKNIQAIRAVPTPNNSGGGGGGINNSFSGATAQTQAPSFNIVGNSGVNQLAQLQQTPVQAYVVSGSVTTAQALDRNRIENATL
jgi:DNA repair exonuclease SbcCD ATPase subunit